MTDYSNENRGAIWGNDKKETDRHPDFTGSMNVDGKEYYVSAWKRKPDANPKAPSLSFSVKAKDQQQQPAQQPAQQSAPKQDDFDNSDIPFANPYKRAEYIV